MFANGGNMRTGFFRYVGCFFIFMATNSYAAIRPINLTIEGTNYQGCYENSDGELFCNFFENYQIEPGMAVCSDGIVYDYLDCDVMSEDCTVDLSGRSYCVRGGECTPGGGYCYDGSTSVKLCSEWSFNCEEIETGPMESIDSANDSFTCIRGYYREKMECKRCPSLDNIYGDTKNSGATSKSECYIPTGTTFTTTVGSGKYVSDCYHGGL